MRLTTGSRLGPYEIIAPIGAGGMGEVYRARDSRLGRSVAIKILPAEASSDPKLRLRFEREARAISHLNHPHICALYDIGEIPAAGKGDQPLQYIVMEYLEGQTLEERLKRGPLSLDEVLRFGLEIADALDKAHRKQILHRDLKPSNIMITKSGVRLFDFGLAKFLTPLLDDAVAPVGNSDETTPQRSITAEGSIMGTLEYMAPEQLRGKEPDQRTDIFSLGVTLYQMITGRRPFSGSTRAAIIAAILDHHPTPLAQYRADVPSRLQWLLDNCFAKDPDDRVQTAHDVKLELARIAEEMREEVAPERSAARRSRWIYGAVVAIAILVTLVTVLLRRPRYERSQRTVIRRFSITVPSSAPIPGGKFEKIAVSPDGSRIVYVGGQNPTNLYLYSVDTLETKLLPQTEGAGSPFFSPDGQWIGFSTTARELKKINILTGASMLLTSNIDMRGAAWGPDDTIVFSEPRSPLRQIAAVGGRIENLTPYDLNTEIRWPSFLPGGELILFTESDFSGDYENARIVMLRRRTGEKTVLINGGTCGRYVPTGHLIYFHSQSLFAVPFEPSHPKITTTPEPLVTDVDSSYSSGLADYAVSADGSLFYLPRTPADGELVWVDREGNSKQITALRRPYETPKISPDGTRALVRIGVPPRSDIWSYDIERDSWTRLTTRGTNLAAIWSPDGHQIAFTWNGSGGLDLYVMPSDGSGPARRITSGRSWDVPTSWSPDGKSIAVTEQYRATFADIFIAPSDGQSKPTPFLATPFTEHEAAFSPDGHWIAYESDESGRPEIYIQAYPRGRRWLISNDGGVVPIWRRDGSELFYRNGNKMMAVRTELHSDVIAAKPQMLFKGDFGDSYDVSGDGKRFLMVKLPKPQPRTEIKVILGLFNKQ